MMPLEEDSGDETHNGAWLERLAIGSDTESSAPTFFAEGVF